MADVPQWEEHYRSGTPPWDTGRTSSELMRVVQAENIRPCRAIELGCGTGTNAVWLAQQGFEVTGVDLVPLAIERAIERAAAAGVTIRFLSLDLLALPDLGAPFDFLFDRGCYHAVRRENALGYITAVDRLLRPGALGLVLAGNAKEPLDPGPPVVSETELRSELGSRFEIVSLTEFRFDAELGPGFKPLAWSCLLRKAIN
ncbi:MAG TPA: methyltransferase domain-containing protein [Pirellulales bacterium]|jgi:SAM-dependent methyltransferase|nr:methyltransferase domain-containing protein [Pirellulales bacterium]